MLENIAFHLPRKLFQHKRYLNWTSPEANHSTYLSFQIPLRVDLTLFIVTRGHEPTPKSLVNAIWAILGFSPHMGPSIDLYPFYFMFCRCKRYLSMKWNAVQGGPNDYILTTIQLLIQIKTTLTYTGKHRIFTSLENYLNTKISQWNFSWS